MKKQKINKIFDTSKYKKEYISKLEIIFDNEKGKLKINNNIPLSYFKKLVDDFANNFEVDYIKIGNKKYGAII